MTTRQESVIVVPARLGSTRLPNKMLLRETGKSLIQHTYEAACQASRPSKVVVATDHHQIRDEVRSFGGNVVMTRSDHQSGADRVAEVAANLSADIIVNLQGDEPCLSGASIDKAIETLESAGDSQMSTLATQIVDRADLDDLACVKVVFDQKGRALYFSRSCIPKPRMWQDDLLTTEPPFFYQHIGLYAYRRDFLLKLSLMQPCALESIEQLEQLRVLYNSFSIEVAIVDERPAGIDTECDYRAFVEWYRCR